MPDPVDPAQFREQVITLVRRLFPELSFTAPPTEWDLLISGETQIGLVNLRAKYELSQRTEEELEALVRDHFAVVQGFGSAEIPFEEARERIRPQIMPMEYALEKPLIAFGFAPELMVGLVLDSERSYVYLRPEDAERWKMTHLQLLDLALANLEEASQGLQIHYSEDGDTKIMFVQAGDGFDAARVLLPKLRKIATGKMGSPCYFAIPNRDFLMLWNLEAPADLRETLRTQIGVDFGCQPYPLSPKVFRISEDGEIHEE
jgi:uncharacterized protein YtpQ (UPF0354 family)